MTAYLVDTTALNYPFTNYNVIGLGIRAGTKQLRINKLESAGSTVHVFRYSGATLNGPDNLTPVPMREGGPVATSTAEVTRQLNASPFTITGAVPSGTASRISYFIADYAFPYDLIIAKGSAIWFTEVASNTYTSGAANGSIGIRVFYEELRLDYSY